MEAAVDTLETPLAISLNFKLLGPRVGPHMQQLHAAAKALTQQQLRQFEREQKILLNGILLTPQEATLQRQLPQSTNPNLGFNCDKNCVIEMDFTEDPSLQRKAIAREIANRVQKLRKQLQLQQQDEVLVFAAADDAALKDILIQEKEYIESCLRRPLLLQEANKKVEAANILYEETYTVAAAPLTLTIVKN
ncbi:isoleucine-tRNA synthetase, putative [Eimeria necatrix]|uniref:Isoleucine-tRNA synthetase, putative n=1 Tax=Eimeria necatrix TaxID=51315 RepID=U6MPY3_9EIME|nr:isoleucine-tRNA synthetase, putative [Eimeria necatrix]CDJ65133.1 isoleucine-tRNA synthetase, putative [Eimeria necatrix]